MKTYTIKEMREKLDKYDERTQLSNLLVKDFLSRLEKEEEKPVPKIEEIQDAYSHDTNLEELSRKINEIIRYINNK